MRSAREKPGSASAQSPTFEELVDILTVEYPDRESAEKAARMILDKRGELILPELIRNLTSLHYSPDEAQLVWPAVLDHKNVLARALGRDPGLRVAALDYFGNVLGRVSRPRTADPEMIERLYREATSDPLTGLANRRSYRARLLDEAARSRRYKSTFVQLVFDLDNFKKVNDTRGHARGDQILQMVAEIIRKSIREADVGARWGGEEFAILMPETIKRGGRVVADRIRETVEHDLAEDGVTISGGLACFPVDGETEETLFQFADRCLYRAKAEGKNRICPSPIERRAFPRIDRELRVQITAVEDKSLDIKTNTSNISLGGIGFRHPTPLWVTGHVNGEIQIGIHPVHFVGRVVHVEEMAKDDYDVGVQFVEITPVDTKVIRSVTD